MWFRRAKKTCAPEPHPDGPLDRPRLGEFSPGPENSHGACSGTGSRLTIATTIRNPQPSRSQTPAPHQPAASSRSRRPVRLRAPCDVMARFDWRFYRQSTEPSGRSGAGKGVGFGCRLDEHVFFASRDGTRNPPLHPLAATTDGTTTIGRGENAQAEIGPDSARREAGQPPSAALMLTLTAPMSARPAAFAFTAPITLPMSFMEVAPVVAMASLMRASTSAAESWSGR